MMIGAFGYRIPPAGWRPAGWTPPAKAKAMISTKTFISTNAHKTPQFWLIWWVLCLNVSAGIGVIGMASPMLQEIFAGKLIGFRMSASTSLTPRKRRRSRQSRPASPDSLSVQHRRPVLLGVAVGQDWP